MLVYQYLILFTLASVTTHESQCPLNHFKLELVRFHSFDLFSRLVFDLSILFAAVNFQPLLPRRFGKAYSESAFDMIID